MFRHVAISLLIVTATIAVYHEIHNHGFIHLDDPGYVFENPHVRSGLQLGNIQWALTATRQTNWHPVTWWSHMLDCQVFGADSPGWHHLTNLALHLANSVLVYLLFGRLTGAYFPSAFVAAVFALHPLHVESVVWISERKDLLSTLFWLLHIIAYVEYVQSGYHRRFFRWSVGLLALGLMAKPMLVTAPILLLLIDYWPLERWTALRDGRLRELIVEKSPMFALIIASCIITYLVQRQGGAVATISFTHRLANAVVAYNRYIGKTFWPVDLAVLYPNHVGMWNAVHVVGAVAGLGCVTCLTLLVRRKRYLLMGWCWFLVTLIPVIGIVQVGQQSMADRYMYIPIVGLSVMVAWSARDLVARVVQLRVPVVGTAVAILVTCLCLTSRQVPLWCDSETLFQHTLEVTRDNHLIFLNLGTLRHRQRRPEEAAKYLHQAIDISPDSYLAHYNLGVVYHGAEQIGKAIHHLQEAIAVDPDYLDAHFALGVVLSAVGRSSDAVHHYRHVINLDENHIAALHNLGESFSIQGQNSKAIEYFRRALQKSPDNPMIHTRLATSYLKTGDLAKAGQHLAVALRLHPLYAPAQNLRGELLEAQQSQ